jgi:hypothetical protein
MKTYLIHITMGDGSKGRHYGLYSDGFDAVIQTMTNFPEACRISARRLA